MVARRCPNQRVVHGAARDPEASKVRAEPLPFVLPPKDGAHLKDRFRLALLGPDAVTAEGP